MLDGHFAKPLYVGAPTKLREHTKDGRFGIEQLNADCAGSAGWSLQ
jgi:hypothetical protein